MYKSELCQPPGRGKKGQGDPMRKYIGTQRVPKAKSTVKAEVSLEGKHQMDVEKKSRK